MTFTLKLGEPIWKMVGDKSLKIDMDDAQTLADVVREMNRRYPGFTIEAQSGKFDLPYSLFVNDTLVQWDKIEQIPVHDGDKLFIFMAVSGGE
jgi:molybdopterin converting factor small subunit